MDGIAGMVFVVNIIDLKHVMKKPPLRQRQAVVAN
jgi:hypothetical protein